MPITSEAFQFSASSSQVTLSRSYDDVRKFRINKLTYTTGSADNFCLLVSVSGWNSRRFNLSNKSVMYTYYQNTPRTTASGVDYEAPVDHWDVIVPHDEKKSLYVFNVQLTINGETTTDITSLNTVNIEFEFEYM